MTMPPLLVAWMIGMSCERYVADGRTVVSMDELMKERRSPYAVVSRSQLLYIWIGVRIWVVPGVPV